MSPEESKIMAGFFISVFEQEAGTTARVIKAIPENNQHYRPDPQSRTALELARHIVLEDVWLLDAVIDLEFKPLPDQTDACGIMTPAQAVETYNEALPSRIQKVKSLSGEHLTNKISLLGMINTSAAEFLSLLIRHSVHHRGQLSAYLRAMGGKVPQIYGPSADEPMETPAQA